MKYVYMLLFSLALLSACVSKNNNELYDSLGVKFSKIRITDDNNSKNNIDIKDEQLIEYCVLWLKKARPINTNFASYPTPVLDVSLDMENGGQLAFRSSHLNTYGYPIIIEYNSKSYILTRSKKRPDCVPDTFFQHEPLFKQRN